MKKFLGTTMIVFLTLIAVGQPVKTSVKGVVKDAANQTPIAGALVEVGNTRLIAGDDGQFDLGKMLPGKYEIKVSGIGFTTYRAELSVDKTALQLSIQLKPSPLFLQPLEVKSIRAANSAPFAKTNLSKTQIAAENIGQDLPFLLNQTPSVVVSSDAGNGVGYTGIHIRGTDATRINVTLNGIPYNDAESMGTYYVDIPDFASSVSSIQIQRGVGTSSNGAGAFGATINLSTNEFIEKAYGELNNSFGSFNTWKNTIKAGTGLINGHFTVDARLSRISSDGYIDRASSDLQSLYLSGAYITKKSSLRLNIISGKEKTYQAWYGVPEDKLLTNRTYNAAGTEKPGTPYDNETDNYRQTHYQLFYNYEINKKWAFNTAAFLTLGKGYYEEYKADQAYADYGLKNVVIGTTTYTATDLVRQRWLDNSFVGQIASLQYKESNDELTIGGGWNRYQGSHFGNIVWMKTGTVSSDYHYYDYPATKTDVNIYAKWTHKMGTHWQRFLDLQYRHVNHIMTGFEGNGSLNVTRSFDFVNPKAGITYQNNGWQAFFSYALGNKEPNRDDFQASPVNQPKAETLHDFELGLEQKSANWNYGATVYYMLYKDQLVLTGKINDVGAYTRTNIPDSYRLGLELQASAKIFNWLKLAGNLSLSSNKIKSFTEYIDNWDTGNQVAVQHQHTDISFSPNVVGGLTLQMNLKKDLDLSILNKSVSKQYMDNTQNDTRKLDGYCTQDIRVNYTLRKLLFKEWHIIGQLNNIFNVKYQPNGYTYNYIYNKVLLSENGYYPMAGTNFMVAVNINL